MTRLIVTIAAILVCCHCLPASEDVSIELECVLQLDLNQELGQLRAVPVSLGKNRTAGILVIYGEDAEIDPYIGMFFFPKSTLRMKLFTADGKVLWSRDLGTGVVPGIWFCPIFAFDLNADGVDEIWYVGNRDPNHPLDNRKYVLERLDGRTGATSGTWSWPLKNRTSTMSHRYRNFILGGYVRGEPVLVTAQGTYGQMALQCWNADMSTRWEILLDPGTDGGTLGSHVCPVVDIDGDDVDEVLWGERCIEFDKGRQLFCAGGR